MIYYHSSVSAGGDVAFARQVNRGNITTNFTGNVNANLDAKIDLGWQLRPMFLLTGFSADRPPSRC